MGNMVVYGDFTGGFNDTVATDSLKDNELQVCENALIFNRGGFRIRKGCRKTNGVSYEGQVEQEIEWPLSDGRTIHLAVIGTTLYRIDDATGAATSIESVGSTRIGWFVYKDRFYFSTGTAFRVLGDYDLNTKSGTQRVEVGMIVRNDPISTHVTDPGIAKHFYRAKNNIVSCDFTVARFGNTADWEDVTDVSGVFPNVVRNVIPDSEKADFTTMQGTQTVAVDKTVFVRNTNPTGGIQYHLYRCRVQQTNVDLWTVDFENTTNWQDVTTNDIAPLKRCKYMVLHPPSLRLFATGDSENPTALYFSEPDRPNFFKGINILFPTTAHGPITGMAAFQKSMMVSYMTSWRVFTGITVGIDASWKELPLPVGCVSHETICLTPNSLTFLSHDGIYTVSPTIVSDDTIAMVTGSQYANLTEGKVEKAIASIANKDKCRAVFFDGKYYLAFGDIQGNARNNKVLCMNWAGKSFAMVTGWQVNDWCHRQDGKLYFATENFILETDTGDNDIEVTSGIEKAVIMDVLTKPFSLASEQLAFRPKFVNMLFISAIQYVTTGDPRVLIELTSDYVYSKFTTAFLNDSFVWGQTWGRLWGHNTLCSQSAEVQKEGYRHQLHFRSESLDNPIYLYSFGMDFDILDGLKPTQMRIQMPLLVKDYPTT